VRLWTDILLVATSMVLKDSEERGGQEPYVGMW